MNVLKSGKLHFALALIIGAVWISTNSFKPLPVILADEWIYRSQVAFLGFDQFSIPNYLYSAVYQIGSKSASFYLNAQILNLIFFLLFGFIVFLFSRKFVSESHAALIALAALLSPLGFYVGFYLPESMYMFMVATALYFHLLATSLATRGKAYFPFAAAAYATLLAASFVKPHAVFFLFILGAINLSPLNPNTKYSWKIYTFHIGSIVAWFVLKLWFGWLIAGPSGFTIFGTGYDGALTKLFLSMDTPVVNYAMGSEPLASPLGTGTSWSTLLLNFSVVILVIASLITLNSRAKTETLKWLMSQQMLFIILGMAIVVFFFQILVTRNGDDHTDRLLFRHLEFLVPLLIPLASSISKNQPSPHKIFKLTIGLVSILSLFIFSTGNFTHNISDSSWLYGFAHSPEVIGFVSIAALLTILFLWRNNWTLPSALLTISLIASVATAQGLSFRDEASPVQNSVDAYLQTESGNQVPFIYTYKKQDAAAFLFLLNKGIGQYSVVQSSQAPLELGETSDTDSVVVIGNLETKSAKSYKSLVVGYSYALGLEGESAETPLALLRASDLSPFASTNYNPLGYVVREDSALKLGQSVGPSQSIKVKLAGSDAQSQGQKVLVSVGQDIFQLELPPPDTIQEFILEPISQPGQQYIFFQLQKPGTTMILSSVNVEDGG